MTKMTEEMQRVRDELADKYSESQRKHTFGWMQTGNYWSEGFNACYEHMEAENSKLREALEFYADSFSYTEHPEDLARYAKNALKGDTIKSIN